MPRAGGSAQPRALTALPVLFLRPSLVFSLPDNIGNVRILLHAVEAGVAGSMDLELYFIRTRCRFVRGGRI